MSRYLTVLCPDGLERRAVHFTGKDGVEYATVTVAGETLEGHLVERYGGPPHWMPHTELFALLAAPPDTQVKGD